MNGIKPDDRTLTYLLGYLTPKQWAEAIEIKEHDKTLIYDLIQQQENTYSVELRADVDAELKQ
jgi:hypothetical protein